MQGNDFFLKGFGFLVSSDAQPCIFRVNSHHSYITPIMLENVRGITARNEERHAN
jgi:hypothetical protein